MTLVSVIVPARDAAFTLGETLRALGPGDHEVIVVDNGSTDATPAVAEAAGATVIRRARGDGPGAARNAGATTARGEVLVLPYAALLTRGGATPRRVSLAADLVGAAALIRGGIAARTVVL